MRTRRGRYLGRWRSPYRHGDGCSLFIWVARTRRVFTLWVGTEFGQDKSGNGSRDGGANDPGRTAAKTFLRGHRWPALGMLDGRDSWRWNPHWPLGLSTNPDPERAECQQHRQHVEAHERTQQAVVKVKGRSGVGILAQLDGSRGACRGRGTSIRSRANEVEG